MTSPACCACGSANTHVVLDLGSVPPSDLFPDVTDPGRDQLSPLALMVCAACGLAQIEHDDTAPEQPLGIEPQALIDQAETALAAAENSTWLGTVTAGRSTVREFPSPHGGTWLPPMQQRGFTVTDGPADVVLDSFGVMHEADQQAAWRARADATATDGVLIVQVHTMAAILEARQWTSLRHGHAAYYSLTALRNLLAAVGMSVVDAHTFSLYGDGLDGTLLIAARHGDHDGSQRVADIQAHEDQLGVTDPARLSVLQACVDVDVRQLHDWLTASAEAGTTVFAYGAASRTVALFSLAGLDRTLVAGVADGSPSKQGRRMPTTDVPIISPAELAAADPDFVLVTLPDLLPELQRAWPQLDGHWVTQPGGPVIA